MSQPKMKIPFNRFLIAINGSFNETYKTDKMNLIVPAIGEHAEDQRNTKGKVIATPASWRKGNPTYVRVNGDAKPMFEGDFEQYMQEVQVGDTVHFSAMVTKMSPCIGKNDEGQDLYVVSPHLLIAIERDGELIPVGFRCLVLPEYQKQKRALLFMPQDKVRKPGHGTIVKAQGDMKEYEECNCTYDEKYAEWVEINKVRYDAPYVSDISTVQLRIK